MQKRLIGALHLLPAYQEPTGSAEPAMQTLHHPAAWLLGRIGGPGLYGVLREAERRWVGTDPHPTAATMDAQSVKRLVVDYERKAQTSETLIEMAMIRLLVARLGWPA